MTLKENAVLMRFSAGVPGEERQDPKVTSDVKRDKALGSEAGKWEKRLYPKSALATVKAKINEARAYHDSVTLPFDVGIGILPASLIMEYGDKMRLFKGQIENLVESDFLADPRQWIEWARREQNGTFEPNNYAGCKLVNGAVEFDADAFREKMRKKFYFRCEPLPVPDCQHYTDTVASLLGTDLQSVNQRVADATIEGQRELLRRLLEPVKHMAEVLGKDKPRIFETLIGNIDAICAVAPALNLTGDAEIDRLISEVKGLTNYGTEILKESGVTRSEAQKKAQAVMDRLSAYKL